jgi:BirA family biotin operon repressor/biotin-[acetyl-CoA-carboxylase] ligase
LASAGFNTPIGLPFTELTEVDSTNIYAMNQVKTNLAGHGAAYLAQKQWAGKGQMGKVWEAQSGQNILLSVVLDPKRLVLNGSEPDPFLVSMLVAVGTFNFFTRYAGDETRIKWPNDIYWRDRKAAGILIENSFRGSNWQWSIAGMGVNINQTSFETELNKAVSLKQITGQTFLVSDLARELCSCVEEALEMYVNQGPDAITTLYNNALYKKGARVTLDIAEQNITATICGVLPNGHLEIELENGTKEAHALGSVKWLLKN